MKKLSTLFLTFGVGFYGMSVFVDTNPQVIIAKSYVFLGLVCVATILNIVEYEKKN